MEKKTALELPVVESYLSIQGEGTSAGHQAYFIRFAGCPLHCSWCDSKYTWKFEDAFKTKVLDILKDLQKVTGNRYSGKPVIVLTGGEPLLYQDNPAFIHLIDEIVKKGLKIEIETSGYREPSEHLKKNVYKWNVSPKLSNSGVDPRYIKEAAKHFISLNHIFKFVVSPDTMINDFKEISAFVEMVRSYTICANLNVDKKFKVPETIKDIKELIWIMPESNDFEKQIKNAKTLVDVSIKKGYNFCLRQHVILWGNKRGV